MQLVEQHVIDRADPRFAVIDAATFKSKNLYNAANYEIRQAFFHDGTRLNYNEIQHRMQSHEPYKALPAKVSQQILMLRTIGHHSLKREKPTGKTLLSSQDAHDFPNTNTRQKAETFSCTRFRH